jgi:uncharacterized membrane protein YgcG
MSFTFPHWGKSLWEIEHVRKLLGREAKIFPPRYSESDKEKAMEQGGKEASFIDRYHVQIKQFIIIGMRMALWISIGFRPRNVTLGNITPDIVRDVTSQIVQNVINVDCQNGGAMFIVTPIGIISLAGNANVSGLARDAPILGALEELRIRETGEILYSQECPTPILEDEFGDEGDGGEPDGGQCGDEGDEVDGASFGGSGGGEFGGIGGGGGASGGGGISPSTCRSICWGGWSFLGGLCTVGSSGIGIALCVGVTAYLANDCAERC